MRQRDLQPEWMDQPDIDPELHQGALVGLSRLNRLTGIDGVIYRHLRKYARRAGGRPLRVLDVASGAGDVPIACMRRALKEGIDLQVTTIDISETAVEEQNRRAKDAGVNLRAMKLDCLNASLPSGFDVVTCSLFMHHLENHDASRLLQSMQMATEQAIVVCDLDRSRFNLALVAIGARLVTRSPVVHFDASTSVRAAFTAEEFKHLAESSLGRPIRVRRAFPCRFVATLDEKVVSETAVAFA